MALRPDRRGSFLFILAVYVVAVGAAWWTWQATSFDTPFRLLAGLVAATAVTYVATLYADNGSVFDAWWSVLPPFAALWITAGSESDGLTLRQLAVHTVVWFWGVRLTANWAIGWTGLDHEDWRYVDLRESWPVPNWLVRLIAVEGVPTFFVWLGCLPLLPALGSADTSFGVLDGLALALGIAAVCLELVADEQMRLFAATKQPGEVMDRGLWKFSRHPNYLGEISFWVSLWLFAVAAAPGTWWVIAGPLGMIGLFAFASIPLLDRRSEERRPAFAEYAARTPALLPWPRKS